MSRFVLDCSMAMAWCFGDQASEDSDAVLDALQQTEAVVPSVWSLEVTNVLLVAERRGHLTPAGSRRALELFAALPITVDDESLRGLTDAILSIGRQYSLSPYDASYLELCMRQGLSLATRDQKLGHAATQAGVGLFPVGRGAGTIIVGAP